MQRAFVVGILLAAVVPCVGMVVVCKRSSSDRRCTFPYVARRRVAGLLLGVNPVGGRSSLYGSVAEAIAASAIQMSISTLYHVAWGISLQRSAYVQL